MTGTGDKRKRVHEKVTASTLGTSLAVLVAGGLQRRGITLSAEEIGALAVLGAFFGGWLRDAA